MTGEASRAASAPSAGGLHSGGVSAVEFLEFPGFPDGVPGEPGELHKRQGTARSPENRGRLVRGLVVKGRLQEN
jgi:hypothetical protein